MMEDWSGKHLVIVGAARQGLALAGYLARKGVKITITDQKDDREMQTVKQEFQSGEVNWALGGHPLSLLDSADLLALSGGVPPTLPFVQEAVLRGISLTNDSQIFLDLVACPAIGITGSAGKTTTTLLVGKMAEHAYGEAKAWIGGNIGNPLISDVDQIQSDDIAVLELSSFQLELMTRAPQVACILNITPNHLDRHRTMEAYTAAKARILTYQTEKDTAVLNRDDPGSWNLRNQVKGRLVSFGRKKPESVDNGTYLNEDYVSYWDGNESRNLFQISDIRLRGAHNLLNSLAASAVALAAGLPDDSIQAGIRALEGVDHRLEFVRTYRGASWYNDSIATAPERAIAALQTFQEPLVLLAGGRDKDLPWQDFARMVLERVRYLVLFGEAAELIEHVIKREGDPDDLLPYQKCDGLKEAVICAAQIVEKGDVVLLSPGGTSFDEFNDFAERGDCFRKWVQELT
jgi:UDP-N-acetylmuramoylalanine--D-glutamate ligase